MRAQKNKTREQKVVLASLCDHESEDIGKHKADYTIPSRLSTSTKHPKRGRVNKLDDKVSACLDVAVTVVTDGNATLPLVRTHRQLGHDPADSTVNHSSIHLEKIADDLRHELRTTVPLTIHWDGKLLQDIRIREILD